MEQAQSQKAWCLGTQYVGLVHNDKSRYHPFIPNFAAFINIASWFTMSNAFTKSKQHTPLLPLPSHCSHLSSTWLTLTRYHPPI